MTKAIDLVKGVAELTRPHNLVVAVVTTFIGYGIVSKTYGYQLADKTFIWPALVVVLIAAAGYVINDYYDIETDRIAKPWRPLVSGIVSSRTARILAYILFALGLAISAIMNPYILLFVAANALLLHEYSRWIKRTGFIGNTVVAYNSAATILFGGLTRSIELDALVPYAVLIPAIYAFLFVLGREIVKGIEDIEGDRRAGIYTIAVAYGAERARSMAILLLGAVVAISPIPALLGIYNVLYAVFAVIVDVTILLSLITLYKANNIDEIIAAARKARSLLKAGFLAGGLAFTLGLL